MCCLFDLWFNDSNPPYNREFYEIIKSFFLGHSSICLHDRTCFRDFLSVVPSGDVFPCARLINEDPAFYLGNLGDRFDAILQRHGALERRYDGIGCETCKWQRICNGGCTAYAYWAYEDVNEKDYLCEGYKILFQRIFDAISSKIWSPLDTYVARR